MSVKANRPRLVQGLSRVTQWKPNIQNIQTSQGQSRIGLYVDNRWISQVSANSTALIPGSQYLATAIQNTTVDAVAIAIQKLRRALKAFQLAMLIVTARTRPLHCVLFTVCWPLSLYVLIEKQPHIFFISPLVRTANLIKQNQLKMLYHFTICIEVLETSSKRAWKKKIFTMIWGSVLVKIRGFLRWHLALSYVGTKLTSEYLPPSSEYLELWEPHTLCHCLKDNYNAKVL